MPLHTLRDHGYRMPAEWEPHQATWLSWPHKAASWLGKLARVRQSYATMVALLARSETVHINVNDADSEQEARLWLRAAGAKGDIRFHYFPTNDAWCRDHGAIFIVRTARTPPAAPPLIALHWEYNGWGAKYPPFDLDRQIPALMADYLGVPAIEGGMVLEGGAIEVNGAGLLLTSEQCLLHPNRNPHLSKAEIEARLGAMLGVTKILWLGEGIIGDDTDGHVDDLTRFVATDTVITMVEEDPSDDNFPILQDNRRRLELMRDLAGKPFTILPIAMPPPLYHGTQRLPASYANYYVGNRVVLVPFYNHPNDERAAATLRRCFPDREVVGIDCSAVILGLGAWHCLSQQVPG